MKIFWHEHPLTYDGTQLRSHWIFEKFRILGDAMVAFAGPCQVTLDHMVDLVDVQNEKPIFSENMLHFVAEFFGRSLSETVALQRLFASTVQQELLFRINKVAVIRGGNDLYEQDAKLSVSIATVSPVSTLLHFGINISNKNTPVKTKGLADYDIEVVSFAKTILEIFKDECATMKEATAKVRPVA